MFVPPNLQSLLSKSSKLCSSTKTCRTQRTLRFVSTAANFVHVPPSVNVNPFTPETVRRSSELQWGNSFRGDNDEDNGRRYLLICGQHFYSIMKDLLILVTLWGHLLYCKTGCFIYISYFVCFKRSILHFRLKHSLTSSEEDEETFLPPKVLFFYSS